MTVEEYLAEMHGRIDALTKVSVALLATHPDGRAILMLSRLGELASAVPAKNAQQAAFSRGILEVLGNLEAGLKTAGEAAQILALKPEGGH